MRQIVVPFSQNDEDMIRQINEMLSTGWTADNLVASKDTFCILLSEKEHYSYSDLVQAGIIAAKQSSDTTSKEID